MNARWLLLVMVSGVVVAIFLWFRVRSASAEPREAPGAGATMRGPVEIERHVRAHLPEIADEQFPENTGLEWTVLGFHYREDLGVVLAEVEPRPDVVGYSRFQFAFPTGPNDRLRPVAVYCLESGAYRLLSTSRGAPSRLPNTLP